MPTPAEAAEAIRRAQQLRAERAMLEEGRRLQEEAVRRADYQAADQLGEMNAHHEGLIQDLEQQFRRFLEAIGL